MGNEFEQPRKLAKVEIPTQRSLTATERREILDKGKADAVAAMRSRLPVWMLQVIDVPETEKFPRAEAPSIPLAARHSLGSTSEGPDSFPGRPKEEGEKSF